MSRRRLVFASCLVLGFFALACGSDGPPDDSSTGGAGGVAGSGGEAGHGGTGGGGEGGTGGATSEPTVSAFDPEEAGRGFRVRVLGTNFGAKNVSNAVFFTSESGVPKSVESKAVAASEDGTWFEVVVPLQAGTGPTLVVVDGPDGKISIEGPNFTVTEERLPPRIDELTPTVFAQGKPSDATATIRGQAFYPKVTVLKIDGAEHPIDWSRSNWFTIVFQIPESVLVVAGPHTVQLHTPNGGDSEPVEFRVAPPINLVGAEATDAQNIVLRFDQPFDFDKAENRRLYSIVEREDAIEDVYILDPSHKEVTLYLFSKMPQGEVWTVRVSKDFVSKDGAPIGVREATFPTYTP